MKKTLLALTIALLPLLSWAQNVSVQGDELKYRTSTGSIKTAADRELHQAKLDALSSRIVADSTALLLKANINGQTFTGTVTLPSTTAIGSVSSTELGYLDGVTSALQTQLNARFTTPSGLTTNTMPKWGGSAFSNSLITDNGTTVTIPTLAATNDALISGITVGKGGGAVASNTAVGLNALAGNSTGTANAAYGTNAGRFITGSGNTAIGNTALNSNTSGGLNTAVGRDALRGIIASGNNTGLGVNAGYYLANGSTVHTNGDNSVFIGFNSRAGADNLTNQVVIAGTTGIGLSSSNTTKIGNTSTTQTHLHGSLTIGNTTTLDASAIADFRSTTKGFLMPRMNNTERNAITSPATGLQIFNTSTNVLNYYNGSAWKGILTNNDSDVLPVSSNALGTVSNATVLIDVDVDLSGATATLTNITLVFAKGKKITNGTLAGTYTIDATDYDQVFNTTLSLSGKCHNEHLSVKWFGASGESPYWPDTVYTALYNQGVDDTPAINHTLLQAKNLGGGRVYLPSTNGAYWVRCQTLYANQSVTNDHGDYIAIGVYDNTTFYGDGESSRLMVVDYMTAADYHATNPIYRTRGLLGFAPWTDSELTQEGIFTAITALNDIRSRKLGRNNVVIKGISINSRVSVHPSANVLFYSIVGVIFGARLYEDSYVSNARGYEGNEIVNCHFYDVAVAALLKNFNYSTDVRKVVKGVIVSYNHITKTSNKAVEYASSDFGYCIGNQIEESDGGVQAIFGSQHITFSENRINNGGEGINITHGSSNIKVLNNIVTDTEKPFLIRIDAALVTKELITENVVVSGNTFFQDAGSSAGYLMAFQGSNSQDNTAAGYLRIRNVHFTNNNFKGNLAKIGVDNTSNFPSGTMSWNIENINFSGNQWDCDVEIVEAVTQSGSRPASVMKDVDFFDDVMAGKTLSIIGDVSDIKFFNNKVKGTITADATSRGRIVFSESDFETGSTLTIPAGSLYLLDVMSSAATVNLTGSTIVVDRRL